MVRAKLNQLYQEIDHYLGIPYFINNRHLAQDNLYVGKGSWAEIKKISNDYKVLKKAHLGIDCSGLAVRLLNYWFGCHLDVRKTSADMLTKPPLSVPILNYQTITTGDLVRQKNGHHVVFIIEKINQELKCVESSRQGRGVHYLTIDLDSHPQVFRLTSPRSVPDT